MKKYIRKAKRLVPPSYVYLRGIYVLFLFVILSLAILRAHEQNIDISSEEMSNIFSEERQKVHQVGIISDWTIETAK